MGAKTISGEGADRYRAGVLTYAKMGYWNDDYEPSDTDVLAVFLVTPTEGADWIEAAAAGAGEWARGPWADGRHDRHTAAAHRGQGGVGRG